jgi:hypothetical protein
MIKENKPEKFENEIISKKSQKSEKAVSSQFIVRILKTSVFPPLIDEWMTYKDYALNKKIGRIDNDSIVREVKAPIDMFQYNVIGGKEVSKVFFKKGETMVNVTSGGKNLEEEKFITMHENKPFNLTSNPEPSANTLPTFSLPSVTIQN